MYILPGVLESSFEHIETAVSSVVSGVKKIQIDVCDGLYVQSKTWPYSHIKTGRIEDNYHIKQLQAEDIGLPSWEKIEYQFDLMIKDPWRTLPVWAQIGATSVVIHPTSCENTEKVLESIALAQGLLMDVLISYTYDEWMHQKESAPHVLTEILTTSGVVALQCMTIKNIGIQGQEFDNRWGDEFAYIQESFPKLYIQLDGGVDADIVDVLDLEPVSHMVIGSAIFKEGNADEHVTFFKHLFV